MTMSNSERVNNRLMIVGVGSGASVIKIPGCEPVSSTTSDELMVAMREANVCCASVLPVSRALELIPGSYIEVGAQPSERWFVLPSGPAPNGGACCHMNDWYALLRSGCEEETEDNTPDCDTFSYRGLCGNS
jgi:hypothetical protein